jgi:lipopolysaccharide assembly outer membrane protein LptD (OstA)
MCKTTAQAPSCLRALRRLPLCGLDTINGNWRPFMKALWVLSLLAVAGVALAQTKFDIRARELNKYGPLTRARGDVELTTDTVLLHADEVDFNADTGEAEARGNVRVKFLSKRLPSAKARTAPDADSRDWLEHRMKKMRFSPELVAQ